MSDRSSKVSTAAAGDTVDLSAEERRSTPRYAFTATAEVVDVVSRTRMNTRISDLSMQGCYVDTNAPFPRRTKVRIRVSASKKTFETQGVVVYSLPNMGMGIAFAEPEPAQNAILKKWIDELSGAAEVEFEPSESDAVVSNESASSKDAAVLVLHDLVTALMRNNSLSDAEGKALLQRLAR
jgi:PilZ domain